MLFELLDSSLIPNIMRTPNDQNDTLGSKNEKHSLILLLLLLLLLFFKRNFHSIIIVKSHDTRLSMQVEEYPPTKTNPPLNF